MWNGASEVVDVAAKTIADVDAVGLPVQPVESAVAATTVRAKLKVASFSQRVVRIVDADERGPDSSGGVVSHLFNSIKLLYQYSVSTFLNVFYVELEKYIKEKYTL